MSTLHRRDWLRQSSAAIAGLGLGLPNLAFTSDHKKQFFAPEPIRLTSNENPYGPSPMARKAMLDAVPRSNRYPWETTERLLEKLGHQYGLSSDHVFVSAGSSQILGLVTHLAAREKGTAVTADPSYTSWAGTAEKSGLKLVRVPLDEKKKIQLPSLLSAVSKDTRLLYLCNPNNPTGTVHSSEKLSAIAEEASKQCIVLIDEAYLEYCEEASLAPLTANNKNIIIAKTFSKIYGLAGARIGYALAHPDTVERLSDLLPWPNGDVSAVSAAAAIASLDDKEFLANVKKWNAQAKDYTQNQLNALGYPVIPSSTNFIYYSIKNYSGNWQENLGAKNILIGRVTEAAGQWTRTTIGTMDEMKSFITAVKSFA